MPIVSLPYNLISEFTDTVRSLYPAKGDPNISSWRYKISVTDSVGNESLLSPFHQTIFFQVNSGNFSWNQYAIEGQNTPVPSLNNYLFLRDDLSNGNWNIIQILSASSTAYTDPNFNVFQNTARWRVETDWSISCDPTLRTAVAINTTKSNTKDLRIIGPNGLSKINAAEINLYPNPTEDILNIVLGNQVIKQITIYDASGRQIKDWSTEQFKNQLTLDIKDLSKGIYFIKINTPQGIIRKSFVKQ